MGRGGLQERTVELSPRRRTAWWDLDEPGPWGNTWRDRHPDAAGDWQHPRFDPHNLQLQEKLRRNVAAGTLQAEDFEFLATGGECFAFAAHLAAILKEQGAAMDEGFYEPAGPRGSHCWTRLQDGTILDVTHYQYDPDRPVMITRPGDQEYDRYIPWECWTAAEAYEQGLDEPTAEQRSRLCYPPPRGRQAG